MKEWGGLFYLNASRIKKVNIPYASIIPQSCPLGYSNIRKKIGERGNRLPIGTNAGKNEKALYESQKAFLMLLLA